MKNLLYLFLALLTSSILSQNNQPTTKINQEKDTNRKIVMLNTKKCLKEDLKLVKHTNYITSTYFIGNYKSKINSMGIGSYYKNLLSNDLKTYSSLNSNELNLTTKPLQSLMYIFLIGTDVYLYNNGNYDLDGTYGRWWGATEFNTSNVWYRYLDFNNSVGRYNYGE